MGSLALDGIGGFPTRNLVDGLMALERKSRRPIVDRKDAVKDQVQAMQALNAKLSSIRTNAWGVLGKTSKTEVADPSKVWQASKGTSSNKTVEVSAREGAQVGSLTFKVDQVAKTQQATITEAQLQDFSDRVIKSTPPTLSVVVGGKVTTIHPATGSASDMAKAINAAKDSGVSATAVRVGDGKYVLQITGKTTGAEDGKFEIYAGDLNAKLVGKATATETKQDKTADSVTSTYDKEALATALQDFAGDKAALTVSRYSTDAKITLWEGSASEKSFTQATNTFKDIMPEVDITVGKVALDKDGKQISPTADKVTVEVSPDPSVASDKVRKMLGAINLVVDEIASRSRPVDKTRDDGTTYKVPGVLGSLSVVRQINTGLGSLMGNGVSLEGEGTVSLAEFGIKLKGQGDGKLHLDFDSSAFEKALTENPNRVEKALNTFAEKVADFSDSFSDSTTGILTQNINSQQSYQKQIDNQLVSMDRRLDMRQKSLELQFSRLQTILQKNQAQGAWLAGQLANLVGPAGR